MQHSESSPTPTTSATPLCSSYLDVLVFGELQAVLGHKSVLRVPLPSTLISAGDLWKLIEITAIEQVSGDAAIQQIRSVMTVAALAVDEEVVDLAQTVVNTTTSTVAVLPPLSGG